MNHPAAVAGPLAGTFLSVCVVLGAAMPASAVDAVAPAAGPEGLALVLAALALAAGTLPVVALLARDPAPGV